MIKDTFIYLLLSSTQLISRKPVLQCTGNNKLLFLDAIHYKRKTIARVMNEKYNYIMILKL